MRIIIIVRKQKRESQRQNRRKDKTKNQLKRINKMTQFESTLTRNEFFQLWNETQENGEAIQSGITLEEFAQSQHRLFSDFNENEEGSSYLKLVDNESGDCAIYKLNDNDNEAEIM